MEPEIIIRERNVQRQWEESKIVGTKYNKRFKEIRIVGGGPNYLKQGNLDRLWSGDEVRTLAKLRCGNLEEMNEYWLKEENRLYLFYGIGQDCIRHYMNKCGITNGWFDELGMIARKSGKGYGMMSWMW